MSLVSTNVPSVPIVWRATLKSMTPIKGVDGEQARLITARLWFEARAIAALQFGCDPEALTVERQSL
jgi:hypothetical protein